VIPPSSSRSAKMQVTDSGEVNFLEHVQAHITLTAVRRGDVQIFLTSPGGTKSNLLARRPHDLSRAGFKDWPFLTVFSWGENPLGTWKLEVQNDGRYQVELHAWSLTFHGTSTDPSPPPPPTQPPAPPPTPRPAVPQPVQQPEPEPKHRIVSKPQAPEISPEPMQNPLPNQVVPNSIENCLVQRTENWCSSCRPGYLVLSGRCVTACPPEGYYQGMANLSAHCFQCYYTCRTCRGSNDYQCESCYGDAQLDKSPSGETYCHNKNLIFKVFSSSRWYYILSLGFLVNTILILVLLVYIYRKKNRSRSLGGVFRGTVLDISPGGKGYRPVSPSEKVGGTARPFHDDSSDEDHGRGFLTPYTDNPAEKPYRDEA